MKLKKHGAFLIDFVLCYVDAEMSRLDFNLDYSGYVIEYFGAAEIVHLIVPLLFFIVVTLS